MNSETKREKYRETFIKLIGTAKSKDEIAKILEYFKKKKIDIGDDYISIALTQYFNMP
jgi:hypothetical protein